MNKIFVIYPLYFIVDFKPKHSENNIIIQPTRDLARNEEFSEIAVINIFFTVLKTKTQLSVGGGGPAGKISR